MEQVWWRERWRKVDGGKQKNAFIKKGRVPCQNEKGHDLGTSHVHT